MKSHVLTIILVCGCVWQVGAVDVVSGAEPEAAVRSLNDLTGPWQLFVDDHLIDETRNVERTFHPFRKHPDNPVLTRTEPWERAVYIYGTVLPTEDGDGYRMWYQTLGTELRTVLYATSPDGLAWDKPELGLREWEGSTANNMIFQRPHGNEIVSIIHTPWDPDPEKRYKILNHDEQGFWAAYSPDGIHITDAPNNPVFTQGGDVAQFLWDFHRGHYVGYVKNIAHVAEQRRRVVGHIASHDVEQWPDPHLVLVPDVVDDRWAAPGTVERTHFYGMSAFNYESMMLAFLWIFRSDDVEGYFDGPVHTELVASRDGIRWTRQDGDRVPMIDVGPPGSWDAGQLYTATQPLVVGDEVWVYYGACPTGHGSERWVGLDNMDCAIGLATLRKDGFASIDAGREVGYLTTKPLEGLTGELFLNYRCGPGGYIRVELLDRDGYPIPGYRAFECDVIREDSTEELVSWAARSELPRRDDEPIRLRFMMRNASLYSFRTSGDVVVAPPGEVPPPFVTPPLAALYTFETDGGRQATDVLTADGVNAVRWNGFFRVDTNADNAAFGRRSLAMNRPFSQLSTLEIENTDDLGRHFTLAAMVRSENNAHARLFSSHSGCGPVHSDALVFDFDPRGRAVNGLRAICKGMSVESGPVTFDDGEYHHLAMTYDDGIIAFYLDGRPVGTGNVTGGPPIRMARNLRVGQDAIFCSNVQFRGHLDDILVFGEALSAAEIAQLANEGAEKFFAQNRP